MTIIDDATRTVTFADGRVVTLSETEWAAAHPDPSEVEAWNAALSAAQEQTQASVDQATAMRDGLAQWVQIPVADRSPATAAQMEAQGKALTLATLGTTDERLIALTAEIGALAQIARQERAAYEEGLLS